MALESFSVKNQKSIRLAAAESVPSVMVIAGPNGVGKSTLLYAIRGGSARLSAGTRVFYQGPHRVLRRTQVRRSWLGGPFKWFLDLWASGDVSGYEGLSFQNSARTPENVDEAGSTIKHTLGKIENRRQSVLAGLVDRRKADGVSLDLSTIPDIYEPLRTLTSFLLPHLKFHKIDFKNEDDIRCVWMRTDESRQLELDIDDLSSGEKSIVVLFLPLLEDQIRERLETLEALTAPASQKERPTEDRVVLIDEPEQHLHPDLQAKILTYIRSVVRSSKTQFVLTTHSPSILDQAFDDELYVLSGPSADPNENQLRRVATNAERLEALRQLAGSTYFLTTGRAIVCIEGERGVDQDEPTDLRLLEIIYPRATAVTLVPTSGKGNVITTVTRLREHVPENVFRIRIRGLVDADQSDNQIPGIYMLPVCMIENFLLDPVVIVEYAKDHQIESLTDPTTADRELQSIVAGLRDEEIALRVQRMLRGWTVRIRGASIEQVKASRDDQLRRITDMLPPDEQLSRNISSVAARVDSMIADGKALDYFRGKVLLKQLHQRHMASKGIAYTEMCLELAKRVGKSGKVVPGLDPIFDQLIG